MAEEEEKQAEAADVNMSIDIRATTSTFFANVCSVAHTGEEVVLLFAVKNLDNPTKAEAVAAIYITQYHAKRLVQALQRQLEAFERDLGRIEEELTNRLTPSGRERFGLPPIESDE